MTTPASADVELSLDPRYITLQRDVGYIVTAAMSFGLAVGLVVLLTPRRWIWCVVLWVLGTSLLARLFHRWPAIEYRHWSYRIDDEGIQIRRGVVLAECDQRAAVEGAAHRCHSGPARAKTWARSAADPHGWYRALEGRAARPRAPDGLGHPRSAPAAGEQ